MGNSSRLSVAVPRRAVSFVLAIGVLLSVVLLEAPTSEGAVPADAVPAAIPKTDTSGLRSTTGEWDTKNQHRVWWNASAPGGGRWDAVLPAAAGTGNPAGSASEWWITKGITGPQVIYEQVVDTAKNRRPDVYWDGTTLYVLMSGSTTVLNVYSYNAGTDTYTPQTSTQIASFSDTTSSRASIYKTPNGDLWVATMDDSLRVAHASSPTGPWEVVDLMYPVAPGQTQMAHYGTHLVVLAAENGDGAGIRPRATQYMAFDIDQDSPITATHSLGAITIAGTISNGDTITIQGRTYTFVNQLGSGNGEVAIEGSFQAARENLYLAVNGLGTPGVDYSSATTPHATVQMSEFGDEDLGLAADTALVRPRVAGQPLTLTPGFSNAANTTVIQEVGTSNWTYTPINVTGGAARADDEISVVANGNTIYFVSETQGGGVGDPQLVLFHSQNGGAWVQHVVKAELPGGSTTDWKRPVVAIMGSDIYVIATNNGRTESAYFRAPLGSLDSWSGPTSIFKTDGETFRNNIVPREPTNATIGLPVLVDNLVDRTIWRAVLTGGVPNRAPAAYAGPDIRVGLDKPVELADARAGNDGTGNPLQYEWTKVSGPGTVTFNKSTDLNPSVSFGQVGTYVLQLSVIEAPGTNPRYYNSDTVTITVDPKNDVPKVTISKPANGAQVTAGTKVTFSATATDQEDGNISSKVVWTSSRDGQIGKGASFTKSNLSVGTHTIKATVVDRQNASASATITLKVVPKPNAPGNPGGPGQPGSPGNPPGEPIGPDNPFGDDNGHVFENDIEWLANKGITRGCNPPTNDRFCPDDFVTRGQMAAFLVRAFSYTDDGGGSRFVDDNGHVFEADIARLAAAGVTKGCNPPKNDRFCPDDFVTRGQMAAFLHRAIGDD